MRALVVTGDGVGNIIQSTPTISYLQELGYTVDVAMPGAPVEAMDLVRYRVGRTSVNPHEFHDTRYEIVIPNFLHSDAVHGWGFTHAIRVPHPIRACRKEAQVQYEALARHLDLWPPSNQKRLPPTWCSWDPKVEEEGLAGSRNLALCMGSKTNGKWRLKRYSPAKYTYVVNQFMQRDGDFHVYVFGTGDDDTIDRMILPERFYKRVHLVWNQPLLRVSAILRQCDLYLGNDTGLSHIAAAHGTHAYVVFGPTEARRSMPPYNATPIVNSDCSCRPCQTHHVLNTGIARIGQYPPGQECVHHCMDGLDWTQVFNTVFGAYREFLP